MRTSLPNPTQDIVLHVDVDAFFCQVEALRLGDAKLAGIPLAIQQHQDVISVDYRARQAGVKKHMAPAEARRLLAAVGGRLVHVYCEDGTRPSYRPYREMSAAFMRLVRGLLPAGAVLEQASIDEAFIALQKPTGVSPPLAAGPRLDANLAQRPQQAASIASVAKPSQPLVSCETGPAVEEVAVMEADMSDPCVTKAMALGQLIRSEAWTQLGLRVSVGLASNKLLAKFASRAAKPDGLHLLLRTPDVEQLLASTPVARLPGMGGRLSEVLGAAGYNTVTQLRALCTADLVAGFGMRPALADCVMMWAYGVDQRIVAERGPPKAIQVQMSLTPVPRPALPTTMATHTSAAHKQPNTATATTSNGAGLLGCTLTIAAPQHPSIADSASGGGAGRQSNTRAAEDVRGPAETPERGGRMLMPLLPGTPEGWARLGRLVGSMATDLVARVLLDRHLEQRWPTKLTVQLVTHGSGGRTTARTCTFPSPGLAPPLRPLPQRPPLDSRVSGSPVESAGKAVGACGDNIIGSKDGVAVGGLPVAAVRDSASGGTAGGAAAAVAVTPRGAAGGSLIIGEHTFFQPGTPSPLLDAVITSAVGLCGSIHSGGGPPDLPLVQVHLTAHSFKPHGAGGASAATSNRSIEQFFRHRGDPPPLALQPTVPSAPSHVEAAPRPLSSNPSDGTHRSMGADATNRMARSPQTAAQHHQRGGGQDEHPVHTVRTEDGMNHESIIAGRPDKAGGFEIGNRANGAHQCEEQNDVEDVITARKRRRIDSHPRVTGSHVTNNALKTGAISAQQPLPHGPLSHDLPPPHETMDEEHAPSDDMVATQPEHAPRNHLQIHQPELMDRAAISHHQPRFLQTPPKVDLLELLSKLWPQDDLNLGADDQPEGVCDEAQFENVEQPAGASSKGACTTRHEKAAEEAVMSKIDAWMGCFGVQVGLEEWWEGLGTDSAGHDI